MNSLNDLLSQKTGLTAKTVTNILKLLEEGSTIPFIARYRKEMTGGATDEQLREFESIYGYSKKLLDRKEEVARLIAERSELNND
ncbi:Tex-like N-terminal domain-containing protein, partial [Sulfuricurvum sp. RIFOXYD2_FULL_44_160]